MSSSSSPEPELSKQLQKKSKSKGKGKATTSHGKNEGVDPNWDYKPPNGVSLIQNTTDAGEFDWDAVANDDDVELWLIRVPESIKPKYLENTKIEMPSATNNVKIGTLNRKHATFDMWSISEGDQGDDVGGEELKALSCLLPRKTKNGQLYPAPKPITRRIVVSARPVAPVQNDPSSVEPIAPYSRPPREIYPKEALTHKFMPYGSLTHAPKMSSADDNPMEVDIPAGQADPPHSPTERKEKKAKRSKNDSPETSRLKGKKRKGEGGEASPKKKLKAS